MVTVALLSLLLAAVFGAGVALGYVQGWAVGRTEAVKALTTDRVLAQLRAIFSH